MTESPKAKDVSILVTGDFAADHNIYLPELCDEEGRGGLESRYRCMLGGAVIVYNLLREFAEQLPNKNTNDQTPSITVAFDGKADEKKPTSNPAAAVWHPKPGGDVVKQEKAEVWRLERSLALGKTDGFSEPPRIPDTNNDFESDILVVEDDAGQFRYKLDPASWPCVFDKWDKDSKKTDADLAKPSWVVLKMTGPVCQGDLWWQLTSEHGPWDRLVVVMPISDLRREDVRISQGISWERTAEDIVRELKNNPVLTGLRKVKHVIIVLNGEGALWVECPDPKAEHRDYKYHLIFDPGHMEKEWAENKDIQGDSYGYMSGFTAALTAGIAVLKDKSDEPKMVDAIKAGLLTTRRIRVLGHGDASATEPGFPFGPLADMIVKDLVGTLPSNGKNPNGGGPNGKDPNKPSSGGGLTIKPDKLGVFGDVTIPANASTASPGRSWRILDDNNPDGIRSETEPLYGVARRVAMFGLKKSPNIPYAQFGKLLTTDRDEIEALRNIKRLMEEYTKNEKVQNPLSVGVFGPPGSGKSFGIKQIAKGILGDESPCLEFNLSQFDDTTDLIGAFHQVRDKVLEGHTPLVFWDEFDSKGYKWLQFLLAPMQDGKFQQNQITHPIGRCIFVLAGATSYDFDNFGPCRDDHKGMENFKLLKGPDFKSRLHGFLNVLGPNQRQLCRWEKKPDGSHSREWVNDPEDVCFPVRRAVLLRAMLGLVGKRENERMEIDHGLLAALLEIDQYTHGSRSMEKIMQSIKRADGCHARRSALPTDEVLAMNTDAEMFMHIAVESQNFQDQAERIAREIHKSYLNLNDDRYTNYKQDYLTLPEPIKADNIAAASRIPWVLGLAGLYVCVGKPDSAEPDEIRKILRHHMETLACEEHELWMHQKVTNGWRLPTDGKRDKAQKLNECLVPYNELVDSDREKDRNSIKNYPVVVNDAGFTIVAERALQRCWAFVTELNDTLDSLRFDWLQRRERLVSREPFGVAVRAVILDQQQRCLLVRRSNACKSFSGTWEWPGGKVDPGETYDAAVLREVAEETGLQIELTGVAGAYPIEVRGIHIAVLCLEATLAGGDLQLSEEHDDSEWVPLEDLGQRDLTPGLREFAEKYIQSMPKDGE